MLGQPPIWLILIAFVCALGPLVFFHELGHYLVARWFRIPAEIFSIGFGRELIGWTDKQGTRWKVAWIPLGGYVKFIGDMTPASNPADLDEIPPELRDRAFQIRPVWQRFLVVLAGPVANFILAIAIYVAFFSLYSAPLSNRVGSIQPKSAAATAGLQPGDRIIAVGGAKTETFNDIRAAVEPLPHHSVTVVFERDGGPSEVRLTIGAETLKDTTGKNVTVGLLGISPAPVPVTEAIPMAITYTSRITAAVIESVAKLVIGEGSREDVGGPIKIAQVAGQAASLGVLPFIDLLALFSINLGFINLLPVPMLDGGHLFFYAVEAILRRPLSARALDWAFRGGLALILALVAFTTINDLGSIGLWDRLQRLIG
jgi:regulator of sigma E protease